MASSILAAWKSEQIFLTCFKWQEQSNYSEFWKATCLQRRTGPRISSCTQNVKIARHRDEDLLTKIREGIQNYIM